MADELKRVLEELELSRILATKNLPYDKIFAEFRPHMVKVKPERCLNFQRITYGLFELFLSERSNSEKHGYLKRSDVADWWANVLKTEIKMMKAHDASIRSAYSSNQKDKLDKIVKEIEDYMTSFVEKIHYNHIKGQKNSFSIFNEKIFEFVKVRKELNELFNFLSPDDFKEKKSQKLIAAILSAYKKPGNIPRFFMMAVLNKLENPWNILMYAKDLENCFKQGFNDLEKFFLNDMSFILQSAATYRDNINVDNKKIFGEQIKNINLCLIGTFIVLDSLKKYENFSNSENWKKGVGDFCQGLRYNLEVVAPFCHYGIKSIFQSVENTQKNAIVTSPDMVGSVSEEKWILAENSVELLNTIRIGSVKLEVKNIYSNQIKEIEFLLDNETRMRNNMINKTNKENYLDYCEKLYVFLKKIKETETISSVIARINKTLDMNGRDIPKV